MNQFRSKGLARRLLLFCLGLYLVVALVATLGEVVLVSAQAQEESHRQLDSLAATFGPPLSEAVWSYNEAELETLLKVISKIPEVGKIQVVSNDGQEWERSAPVLAGEPRTYPLTYENQKIQMRLGTFALEPSLTASENQILGTLWMALFRTSLVVAMLSLILIFSVTRLVTKPLRNLSAQMALLDVSVPDRAALVTDPRAGAELQQVADTFNTLLGRFGDREAEILRLNATLESKVEERTAALNIRNQELEQTILELTATRERLVESAKMAVLGQLVAGVAHELNTPLGASLSSSRSAAEAVLALKGRLIAILGSHPSPEKDLLSELLARSQPSRALVGHQNHGVLDQLTSELTAVGVPEPDSVGRDLLELGIEPPLGTLAGLAARNVGPAALEFARDLATLEMASQIMTQASQKMSTVVETLLGYSRKGDSATGIPLDLQAELETVLRLFTPLIKGGIAVVRNFCPLPPVTGNRDQLQQVWSNLIANAIQALGGHGTLTLGIRTQESWAEVAIEDDGPEIPSKVAQRLFTPFFTTKPQGKGTGLGLAICRSIIDGHGGQLSFESGPGKTIFLVRLPLSQADAARETTSPRATATG